MAWLTSKSSASDIAAFVRLQQAVAGAHLEASAAIRAMLDATEPSAEPDTVRERALEAAQAVTALSDLLGEASDAIEPQVNELDRLLERAKARADRFTLLLVRRYERVQRGRR